jgi:hypothetical protein
MVIKLLSLPQETINKYDLIEVAQDGKVYIEIQKGMYGLPQADILTNEVLQRNLAKDGYRLTQHTWPMEAQYSPNIILVSSR